jgi:hypothetical protein
VRNLSFKDMREDLYSAFKPSGMMIAHKLRTAMRLRVASSSRGSTPPEPAVRARMVSQAGRYWERH